MAIDYRIEWNGASGQPGGERVFVSLEDDAYPVTIEVGDDHFTDVISVPLFLTELHSFLHEASQVPRAVWRLEFEPVMFGYRRAGVLEVTRDSEGQDVLTRLTPEELTSLLNKVQRDMKRYGSIQGRL